MKYYGIQIVFSNGKSYTTAIPEHYFTEKELKKGIKVETVRVVYSKELPTDTYFGKLED